MNDSTDLAIQFVRPVQVDMVHDLASKDLDLTSADHRFSTFMPLTSKWVEGQLLGPDSACPPFES